MSVSKKTTSLVFPENSCCFFRRQNTSYITPHEYIFCFSRKSNLDMIEVAIQPQVPISWGFKDPSTKYLLVIGCPTICNTKVHNIKIKI